jgi:hypothetical protein
MACVEGQGSDGIECVVDVTTSHERLTRSNDGSDERAHQAVRNSEHPSLCPVLLVCV